MEEPHILEKKRTYKKKSWGSNHKPLECKIGEDCVEKLSLLSVKKVEYNDHVYCAMSVEYQQERNSRCSI
jgi:hypothetical protein